MGKEKCEAIECNEVVFSSGMCQNHYLAHRRWIRQGHIETQEDFDDVIIARIVMGDGSRYIDTVKKFMEDHPDFREVYERGETLSHKVPQRVEQKLNKNHTCIDCECAVSRPSVRGSFLCDECIKKTGERLRRFYGTND